MTARNEIALIANGIFEPSSAGPANDTRSATLRRQMQTYLPGSIASLGEKVDNTGLTEQPQGLLP
jgi:hypothetical protein